MVPCKEFFGAAMVSFSRAKKKEASGENMSKIGAVKQH